MTTQSGMTDALQLTKLYLNETKKRELRITLLTHLIVMVISEVTQN